MAFEAKTDKYTRKTLKMHEEAENFPTSKFATFLEKREEWQLPKEDVGNFVKKVGYLGEKDTPHLIRPLLKELRW